MAAQTRIRTVSFRSCVIVGKFQTVHVEATADVPLNRKPEGVLEDLKRFVAKELIKAKEGEEKSVMRSVKQRVGRFADELVQQQDLLEDDTDPFADPDY